MKLAMRIGKHIKIKVDTDYPQPSFRLMTLAGHAIGPRLQKQLPMPVCPIRCLTEAEARKAFEIWEEYMERQESSARKGTK